MNISHKNKTIWWAPERCGTKASAHIFRQFDFDMSSKNRHSDYQSHEILPPPTEYNDYNVICSIRNPYDRMLGVFSNFVGVGMTSVYFKTEHNRLIETFSNFIDELLKHKTIKPKFEFKLKREKVVLDTYVSKYNFDVTIPSNYIRMENIIEDMGKLDFIRESPLWSSGYIENYLKKNEHIIKRPYQFDSVYTFESAKKVYEYHKQFFLVLGYDPFSFTTEELTNEEKMNFLHGIL